MASLTTQQSDQQNSTVTNRPSIALIGNPNAGKTALFNALTGLRAKTANYPGITVDCRVGQIRLPNITADLLDLPGLYSLDALSPEEKVAEAALRGELESVKRPDVVVLVVDATNVERHLSLASEILDLRLPTIVALNLIDAADSAGITIDAEKLASQLKCPVIRLSARTGQGLEKLRDLLDRVLPSPLSILSTDHVSCTQGCAGCSFTARFQWAASVANDAIEMPPQHSRKASRLDRILTNPWLGTAAFLLVMMGVFYTIFSLAGVPMTLIEELFSIVSEAANGLIDRLPADRWLGGSTIFGLSLASWATVNWITKSSWTWPRISIGILMALLIALLPVQDFQSLVVDGIIGGVGGVLVFLPQICILFFFISLLEDSGYMARAAFVMERLMRCVGLPGKAFVPMLSSHACAIPGIMAARVIDNWRDRLVTILVLPLLTCSARLPVYAMVAALLFGDSPAKAALVFVGAYLLGIAAALLTAYALKKSILPGEAAPLVLELPPFRMPSLRNALGTIVDRATVFIRRAGTVILLISIVLWGLTTYPKLPENTQPVAASGNQTILEDERPSEKQEVEENATSQQQLEYSCAGRLGHMVEPIFDPLGFDWKINVGILSSFAAREVIVSTLSIVYGLGEEGAEDETSLVQTLRKQERADGRPVYNTATCLSLLVFYVLAMQCLPTQVVTRRETGSWKWAIFQLGYMTLLAYAAALLVYQTAVVFGLAH